MHFDTKIMHIVYANNAYSLNYDYTSLNYVCTSLTKFALYKLCIIKNAYFLYLDA